MLVELSESEIVILLTWFQYIKWKNVDSEECEQLANKLRKLVE